MAGHGCRFGRGLQREVLREATERGFAIDDVSTETIGRRAGANGHDEPNGRPAMVEMTLHVHGRQRAVAYGTFARLKAEPKDLGDTWGTYSTTSRKSYGEMFQGTVGPASAPAITASRHGGYRGV